MVRPSVINGVWVSAVLVAAFGSGAVGQSPAATPVPSVVPATADQTVSLGADTLVFSDDLSHPYEWWLDADADSSTTWSPGALVLRVDREQWGRWDWHTIPDNPAVLRVSALVRLPQAAAMAGPACGSSGDDPRFWAGALTNDGRWAVVRIPEWSNVDAGPLRLGSGRSSTRIASVTIECGATDDGDRILLWVNGTLQADVSDPETRGPFDKVGIHAYAFGEPVEARFQQVTAVQGDRDVTSTGDPAGGPPDPTWPAAPADAPPPPLGATTVLGTFTFDEPQPRQIVGDDDGWFESTGGVYRLAVASAGASFWLSDPLGVSAPVVGIGADVTLPADGGGAGPMCGSGTDQGPYYAAAATSGNMLALYRIEGSSTHERFRGSLPRGVDITGGGPVRTRIECAVVDAETDRVAVWIGDDLVMDTTMPGSIGPFDRYGVALWAKSPDSTAEFDNLEVSTNLPPEASGAP
jgi:hypothetical protein